MQGGLVNQMRTGSIGGCNYTTCSLACCILANPQIQAYVSAAITPAGTLAHVLLNVRIWCHNPLRSSSVTILPLHRFMWYCMMGYECREDMRQISEACRHRMHS